MRTKCFKITYVLSPISCLSGVDWHHKDDKSTSARSRNFSFQIWEIFKYEEPWILISTTYKSLYFPAWIATKIYYEWQNPLDTFDNTELIFLWLIFTIIILWKQTLPAPQRRLFANINPCKTNAIEMCLYKTMTPCMCYLCSV